MNLVREMDFENIIQGESLPRKDTKIKVLLLIFVKWTDQDQNLPCLNY